MIPDFVRDYKCTRVSAAVAVGTTTITTSAVDMAGWDGVVFVALFGAITDGTPAIKARQGKIANMSDGADLAGTLTALAITDDDKVALLEVSRPQERYVDCQIVRGGATGAVIDGVLAWQYNGRKQPVTQDTSVAIAEYHSSPAEGTA